MKKFLAKKNTFGLFLFPVLLGLAACSSPNPLQQGILVVGIEGNPTDLDPRTATDAYSNRIDSLVYNGLIRLGPKAEILPDLAQGYEIKDPLTYIFHLRKGVRFHQGKGFNARDVQYTLQSILDPKLGSTRASTFRVIQAIEAPDEDTVIFKLKEPYAALLNALTTGIVPVPDGRGETGPPPGTGPFRLREFRRGEKVVLEANPDYFAGPPEIKQVVFRVIPNDTTRVMEIEKGGINLLYNAVPPDLLPLLEADQKLQIVRAEGTSYSYLGLNLRDPVLSNFQVRKALALAIDRQAIIRDLLRGLARPASGVLAPSHWAYHGQVAQYAFDPARARRLLDEAGYPDPDGDGPEKRFVLSYKTSQDRLRIRIAEVIGKYLEAVGIGVEIRSYEWGTFFADIRNGNFQLFSLTWVGVTEPDIYHYVFHSRSLPPDGANRGGYANPGLDRLLEQGRRETDSEKRREVYARVQEIVAGDLPYISLWHNEEVAVLSREIRGFQVYPGGDLISLQQVRIGSSP